MWKVASTMHQHWILKQNNTIIMHSRALQTHSDSNPSKPVSSRAVKKIENLSPADLSTRPRPKSPRKEEETPEKTIIPTVYKTKPGLSTSSSNPAPDPIKPYHRDNDGPTETKQLPEFLSVNHQESKSSKSESIRLQENGENNGKNTDQSVVRSGKDGGPSLMQKIKSYKKPPAIDPLQPQVIKESTSTKNNRLSPMPAEREQENEGGLKPISASTSPSNVKRARSFKKTNIAETLKLRQEEEIRKSSTHLEAEHSFRKPDIVDSLNPNITLLGEMNQRVSSENIRIHLDSLSNQGSPNPRRSKSFQKSNIIENINKLGVREDSFTSMRSSASHRLSDGSFENQQAKTPTETLSAHPSPDFSSNTRTSKNERGVKVVPASNLRSSNSPDQTRHDQKQLKKRELTEQFKKQQQQQILSMAPDVASARVSESVPRESKRVESKGTDKREAPFKYRQRFERLGFKLPVLSNWETIL